MTITLVLSRRARISVIAALLGLSSSARADVTVLYAPPGPPPPLVASVVPRSELPEPVPSDPTDDRSPRESETAPTSSDSERTVPSAPPRATVTPSDSAPHGASARPPDPAPSAPLRAAAPAVPRHPESAPPRSEPSALVRPPAGDRRVRLVRRDGDEREEMRVALVDSEGRPDPAGLEALSILARPSGASPPSDAELTAHRDDLSWVSDEVRRLHPALSLRLEAIRRAYPGRAIELVSGLRETGPEHSRHRTGRALDVRVEGVSLADLDRVLRAVPETGVGLCPASDLVHLDIRARSAHWVDLHP